jgi:hypothetical protein
MNDEPKLVSLQAIKRNTTIHIGDGRRAVGPHTAQDDDGDDIEVEGETIADVPAEVAGLLVAKKMGKIVK